jgi:carbonic anhydrase
MYDSALAPNLKGFDAALAAGADEIVIFGAASEAFSQKIIAWPVAESIERFRDVAQATKQLWISCSDSRVSAHESLGLMPAEVFVHRNSANLVFHADLTSLLVLQHAIEILKVEHIMVVGHYGRGGVQAAAERRPAALADNWLRHIEDVMNRHASFLDTSRDDHERGIRLCELSVVEQVSSVCRITMVGRAWYRRLWLAAHGLVHDLHDGLLRPIGVGLSSTANRAGGCEKALSNMINHASVPRSSRVTETERLIHI